MSLKAAMPLVVATGLDWSPWPGDRPHLWLSRPEGKLAYSEQFESLVSFHHGASAGDIDNDGDLDIVLTDGGAHEAGTPARQPLILDNDGQGTFRARAAGIPLSCNEVPFFSVELVDVDRDGFIDMLAGGDERYVYEGVEYIGLLSTVFWGDGSGGFSDESRTILPEVRDWGAPLDFLVADLDGDGVKEIVVLRTNNTEAAFYKGYRIQFLERSSARRYAEYDTIQDENAAWLDWLRLMDVDDDGAAELIADDRGRSLVWQPDGTGRFR